MEVTEEDFDFFPDVGLQRALRVARSFCVKLLWFYIGIVLIVLSLQLVSIEILGTLQGVIPYIREATFWKVKLGRALISLDTQPELEVLPRLGLIVWLVMFHSTLIFMSSLRTIFVILAIHYYGGQFINQAFGISPDWLTEAVGLHGSPSDQEIVEPVPELVLDSRLASLEETYKNSKGVLVFRGEKHTVQWEAVNETTTGDDTGACAGKFGGNSSFASPLTTGRLQLPSGSPKLTVGKSKTLSAIAENGLGSSVSGSSSGRSSLAASPMSGGGGCGSGIGLSSSSWYVYDPQYGVVTEECRDKWHKTEACMGADKESPRKPSRVLPPVRFSESSPSSPPPPLLEVTAVYEKRNVKK